MFKWLQYLKLWRIGIWLLLKIYRKSYIESPTAPLDLTFSVKSRVRARSALKSNRSPYMGSVIAPLDSALRKLEGSNIKPFRFYRLISYKGSELAHMLLWNTNRIGIVVTPLKLHFE